MQKKIFLISFILIGAIAIWGSITTYNKNKNRVPSEIETLAQCINDAGAKFYGAFWCPHCQNQKKMFGKFGAKKLPYTECSTADGKSQLQVCKDAGIEGYPTWVFSDGTKLTGDQTPLTLAEKTSCPISETLKQIER